MDVAFDRGALLDAEDHARLYPILSQQAERHQRSALFGFIRRRLGEELHESLQHGIAP
jgi:hypothetical protein